MTAPRGEPQLAAGADGECAKQRSCEARDAQQGAIWTSGVWTAQQVRLGGAQIGRVPGARLGLWVGHLPVPVQCWEGVIASDETPGSIEVGFERVRTHHIENRDGGTHLRSGLYLAQR